MTRILSLLAIVAAACGIASATDFAGRASATMDSLYSHYSSDHQALLRENHPFDDGYRAGYLAGEATETNKYSYLWPSLGHPHRLPSHARRHRRQALAHCRK